MELGVFNPIYRNHSGKGTRFREPWIDGPEHEAIRRRYIETRYRLLPYIYTGMEATSRTGVPLMRPMFLEFPGEPNLAINDEEYMFGDSLLVAPKVWEFTGNYSVSLPAGEWYDFWTGAKVAGNRIDVTPALDMLPVYVRAGSIIPEQPVVQHVEETPRGPMVLNVYPGPQCHGSLYADDGNTLAYQHGDSLHVDFTCEVKADHMDIDLSAPTGHFQPWFKEIQMAIHGVKANTGRVSVDSGDAQTVKVNSNLLMVPPFKWAQTAHHVRVEFGDK
jgi:alpha-glucosidase